MTTKRARRKKVKVPEVKLTTWSRLKDERPACLIEAFVRDDMLREFEKHPSGKGPFEKGTVFLRKRTAPVVGAYIKMQVNCKPEWDEEFQQEVNYCLMGGCVHTVVDNDRVLATLSTTSLPAPRDIDCGDWDVELVRVVDMRFPWVMESMRKRVTN